MGSQKPSAQVAPAYFQLTDNQKHDDLVDLINLLNLQMEEAKKLLELYNWNMNTLLQALRQGKILVLASAGLRVRIVLYDPLPSGMVVCNMCLHLIDSQDMTMLDSCGHLLCNSCWRQYILNQIRLGIRIDQCTCYDCHVPLNGDILLSTVFEEIQLENRIENLLRHRKHLMRQRVRFMSRLVMIDNLPPSADHFNLRKFLMDNLLVAHGVSFISNELSPVILSLRIDKTRTAHVELRSMREANNLLALKGMQFGGFALNLTRPSFNKEEERLYGACLWEEEFHLGLRHDM